VCHGCKGKIGLEIEYKYGCRQFGYSFSKDKVMWRCADEKEYHKVKKWTEVPFQIDEEPLFESYLSLNDGH